MTVKTVACLAGDGVGPELMAAATRALESVTRLHAFELDDVHLPFAGEAVTRSGHPLPPETRAGYRNADAILVASPDEPAFDGVKADLALAWRVARVHVEPVGDIVIAGPMGSWANSIALARAFSCAASRHGRVVTVGDSKDWRAAVEHERLRWDGLEVEELPLGATLVRLRDHPESLDVVVTEAVDPMGMLLTASLMLAEGLKRRAASRTLERAVGQAASAPRSAAHDTRSFTDAVIELMPQARTDVEHYDEVWS
jgi:isocitrate/isopropylmalate dehydrogenase